MTAPRTDDPLVVMAALRIVEAVLLDDRERLDAALESSREQPFAVLLSLASLAAELLRSAPQGEAWLQHLMLGMEVEVISDAPQ